MPKYTLSEVADRDLNGIAEYGVLNFGVERTRQYQAELKAHFEILANEPLLYPAVDEIREGYRRSVCGVHAVYYRITDTGVEIMALIRG